MFGDLLEWLAGAAFIAAICMLVSIPAGLLAGAVFLFYEAQCYSGRPIRRTKGDQTS